MEIILSVAVTIMLVNSRVTIQHYKVCLSVVDFGIVLPDDVLFTFNLFTGKKT